MTKLKLASALLITAVATGCVKDKLDFSMADDLRFNPEMEAPLVNAYLSLSDIVHKDSEAFFVDANNALRIKYRADEIFSFNPVDFVDIPDQDPVNFPVIVGMPALETGIAMGTMGGVELTQAEFYKGYCLMNLQSSSALASAVEVEFSITNAQNAGQVLKQNLILPAGSLSVQDTLHLSGAIFDLSDGGQSVNSLRLKLEVVNTSPVLIGSALDMSLEFAGLELEEATGYFGQRSVNIPTGAFDFDISGIKEFADGFYLNSPIIKLITASNMGVEIDLNPDLDGVNREGKVTGLGGSAKRISAASSSSVYDTSYIEFNPGNSNIVDFFASLPSKVLYSGTGMLNPDGPGSTNFLNRNSEIKVGVDIDLPLNVNIKNMKLEQVLSDINLFESNPDQFEALTLIFHTSNGFPFDLDLEASFMNSATGDSLHGFNLGLLTPAVVDGQGQILQRGEPSGPIEITIDGENLERMKSFDQVRLKAVLNTTGNGNDAYRFYTHYDLEIKVATRAKLKIETSN